MENTNPDVVSFEKGSITALTPGTISIKYYDVINTIHVYDILSSKYQINNEEKYIYTKTDVDSNTILSNITLDNINGRIENNKLILYDKDAIVDEYKI